MCMWYWLPVRYIASVECSVVSTGLPTVVLVHEMDG